MHALKGMKRLAASVLLASGLSSCGWYTNVPAQVHVQNVDPGTVSIVYNGATTTFTNPTVSAISEPGSIGVTYSDAKINYIGADGKSALTADMGINLRVEASVPTSTPNNASGGQTGGTTVVATIGKSVFPIVNSQVLGYGKSNNNGSLSAQVTMTGIDDAHFPSTLVFYVPIVFSGQ